MAMTKITTNTSSGAATSSFTSGIDSTYKLYNFKFFDVNPVTDGTHLKFQGNASGGSGYDETITSTLFWAYHKEDDSGTPALAYVPTYDLDNSTSFQIMSDAIGNGGDECLTGELNLIDPSNGTFVTHFFGKTVANGNTDQVVHTFFSGYFNTTTAITDIQFKMDSGNMDAVIAMYGVG